MFAVARRASHERRSRATPIDATSRPLERAEHRIDPFGRDHRREGEERPEHQHAGGVGDGDRGAQAERLARRAALADEVRGHHGLAVAGGQGVHRAEEDGDADGGDGEAERELLAGHEVPERVGGAVDAGQGRDLPGRRRGPLDRRELLGAQPVTAGAGAERGALDVERGRQSVGRVRGEALADAGRRQRRTGERDAVADRGQLVPTDPPRAAAVDHGDRQRPGHRDRGRQPALEAGRVEPRLPRREGQGRSVDPERRGAPADRHLHVVGCGAALPGGRGRRPRRPTPCRRRRCRGHLVAGRSGSRPSPPRGRPSASRARSGRRCRC